MKKSAFAAILAFAAAHAAAASNPETLFSCTLQNGKRVDIRYQAAKGARAATVLYRYGANLSRPEIALPACRTGVLHANAGRGGTFGR